MPFLLYKFQQREHRFPLKPRVTIGRTPANDLCVPCDSISSTHALVKHDGSGYQLVDKGSRNGIHVGGQRVSALTLEPGAVFTLGDVEFRFVAEGHAAEATPPPPAPASVRTPPEVLPQSAPITPPSLRAADSSPPAAPQETTILARETAPPEPGFATQPPPLPTPPPVPGPALGNGGRAPADVAPCEPPNQGNPPAPTYADAPATEAGRTPLNQSPEEVVARFKDASDRVLAEIGKTVIGQKQTLNQMLVALFARGHCLLIGVPGLAKTLMVKTLGQTIDLLSNRIQFTPDLMPSDITGTDILEEDSVTGKRNFRFHRGPLFTNLLLADEINRTPPKTQAALLEAMQEHHVTISGATYALPEPFMVLATQNPIEQEGTYPLPEAQLDRFMFCIHLSYPSAHEEQQVILDTTRELQKPGDRILNAVEVLELQRLVRQVPVSQHVASYALEIIRATRPDTDGAPDFIKRWVRWGAGTRAGQYLLLAAKAHVLLQGRFSIACADIREYALPVLRHRIFPNFTAASEGVNTDQIVKRILGAVKEPKY